MTHKLTADVLVLVVDYPDNSRYTRVLGTPDDYDREVTIEYPRHYIDSMGNQAEAYTLQDVEDSIFMKGGETRARDTLYDAYKGRTLIFNGEANYAPTLGLIKVHCVVLPVTVPAILPLPV